MAELTRRQLFRALVAMGAAFAVPSVVLARGPSPEPPGLLQRMREELCDRYIVAVDGLWLGMGVYADYRYGVLGLGVNDSENTFFRGRPVVMNVNLDPEAIVAIPPGVFNG